MPVDGANVMPSRRSAHHVSAAKGSQAVRDSAGRLSRILVRRGETI